MSPKDPNNVSGLLKMHLREHHLLSKQSAAVIQTVIAPGMVSGMLEMGLFRRRAYINPVWC